MSRRRTAAGLAVLAASTTLLLGAPTAVAGTAWTTYHGDPARSGVDASEPSLSPIKEAWAATLDGARAYGQPVVADGRVFVATEKNDVYALDAHDGHVLWSHNIGTPLTNVSATTGCGNIDPLGITSTPVVDTARNTVFVAGEISLGGSNVEHMVVGFDVYTGARTVATNADPTGGGDSLVHLQQRAALAVGNGRVYVAYGGLDGDCGFYHGWVVGVDETGSRPNVEFDTTPTSSGGAIWAAGGGPSIDSAGNVYVVTGNPNNGAYTAGSYGDSAIKLSPSLQLLAATRDPVASPGADEDFGTGDALLLPNGTLFTVGKSHVGYVMSQSNLAILHSIGGVCGSDPDGGATYDGATNNVYVPCRGVGLQQVNLGNYSLGWRSSSGADGSPILVAGHLWATEYGSSPIQERDPATGGLQQQIDAVHPTPGFATPSAADGLLLVGTDAGIEAFDGPSGPPPPAPPPPPPTAGYRLVATDGGVFSFGTAPYYGSLGNRHLNAPIVGAARTADGRGYWMVGSDGGIFSFGDARFFGSTGGRHLNQSVVGMAPAPGGGGYWLVARDGGVFTFGPGARYLGSTGGHHINAPVVAMAADGATGGYWLFGADGGVYTFGARFFGSAGSLRLARPVVGAAAAPGGQGYWLVASDGGVFTYGPGAGYHGSTHGFDLPAPIVGMAVDAGTGGYWLTGSDGSVYAFGAPFEGSTAGLALARPVVAVTAG